MKKRRVFYLILFVLAIPLGALMFVYGEIDDSPGGQLIGLIVATIGAIGLIKNIFSSWF